LEEDGERHNIERTAKQQVQCAMQNAVKLMLFHCFLFVFHTWGVGFYRTFSSWDSGYRISNTVLALTGKLALPSVYNPDMVAEKYVNVELSGQHPGLEQLGIDNPRKLEDEIERVLLPHRAEPVDRFPDAEIMKRDAKDTASF
jgi:hypothetical protein